MSKERTCPVCEGVFLVARPCRKQVCCSFKCRSDLKIKKHQEQALQNLNEIREYRKDHTLTETMKRFEMSSSSLFRRKVFDPITDKRRSCPDALSAEQKDFITGNLLGDGSLSILRTEKWNSSFSIKQKSDKREYIQGLYDIYYPFSSGIYEKTDKKPSRVDGKISHNLKDWKGDYTQFVSMYTVSHPAFKVLRQKWYQEPDAKSLKIIPKDLVLNWRIAALWMCDDGSNNKNNRSLGLYTDGFSHDEVEFLVHRLNQDLNVIGKINLRNNQAFIKIYGDEWFRFVEEIKPFITWKCFQYKCVNRHKANKSSR